MVVEAEEEHVGLLLRQPLRHRVVAFEERLPVRFLLLPRSKAIAMVGTCEVPMPPMIRAMTGLRGSAWDVPQKSCTWIRDHMQSGN